MSTELSTTCSESNSRQIQARVQLGGASAMAQTIEDLNTIRAFVRDAMVKDLDFGVIPGTGSKATLLQPGAQKILMYLNCYPDYDVETHELPGGHVEYIVKTRLLSRTSQAMIGAGIGSCSTMESKYRWRKASRLCPECGSDAIIKGKKDFGGGWLCFGKKGGCGRKFKDGDASIESQVTGRAENPDVYDARNTVLKMAKKRSLVDAAHGLGCMSELFTQDMEDHVVREPHDSHDSDQSEYRDQDSRGRAPTEDRWQRPQADPPPLPSSKEVLRFGVALHTFVTKMNAAWADRHTDVAGEIPGWVGDLVNSFQLVNHTLKVNGVHFADGGKANDRMRAATALWLADERAVVAEWRTYVKGLADELDAQHASDAEPEIDTELVTADVADAPAEREPDCDDDYEPGVNC